MNGRRRLHPGSRPSNPADQALAFGTLALDDLLRASGATPDVRRSVGIMFVRQMLQRFRTMTTETAIRELHRIGADYRAAVERGEVRDDAQVEG